MSNIVLRTRFAALAAVLALASATALVAAGDAQATTKAGGGGTIVVFQDTTAKQADAATNPNQPPICADFRLGLAEALDVQVAALREDDVRAAVAMAQWWVALRDAAISAGCIV